MLNIITDMIQDWKRTYEHRRELKFLRLNFKRKTERCVAEYGDHNWDGIYYSHEGKKCKNCALIKRHWTFNDKIVSSYDKK